MNYGQQKAVAHSSPTLLSLSPTGYTGSKNIYLKLLDYCLDKGVHFSELNRDRRLPSFVQFSSHEQCREEQDEFARRLPTNAAPSFCPAIGPIKTGLKSSATTPPLHPLCWTGSCTMLKLLSLKGKAIE